MHELFGICFFTGYGIMRNLPFSTVSIITTSLTKEYLNSALWMSLMSAFCLSLHVILFSAFFWFVVDWNVRCPIILAYFLIWCRQWKYSNLERLWSEGQTEACYCIFFNPRSQTWRPMFKCRCGLATAVWISGTFWFMKSVGFSLIAEFTFVALWCIFLMSYY